MLKKNSLRERLQRKRKSISAFLRRKKSRKIFIKLFRNSHFQKAEHIALYYSVAGEVETRSFLKKIFNAKKIYLPKVNVGRKGLTFRRVHKFSDLAKGTYNIMEPKTTCPKRSVARMSLIVVPGVGFDRTGRRLGRGGGYYDRVLRGAKKVMKIGLCFREQVVTKIPVKKHDVRVDQVITD